MHQVAVVFFRQGPEIRAGLAVDGRVMDVTDRLSGGLSAVTPDPRVQVFEQWEDSLTRFRSAPFTGDLALETLSLVAPVNPFGSMYCAGANYRSHVLEMAQANGQAPDEDPKLSGQQPWHFLKPARVCAAAHGDIVRRPAASQRVDWEAELAVIIGSKVEDVTPEQALSKVAGYACANDFSARDLSRRPQVQPGSPFRFDWLAHKCFAGSSPVGPGIVPADAVPDPQRLGIRLTLNGQIRQDANTSDMIFSVAEQIAHLSTLLPLYPGDVVLTGTPAGVGSATQTFLQAGDRVSVEIDGLGALTTTLA